MKRLLVSKFGLAARRHTGKQTNFGRFGSPFSPKLVVYEHTSYDFAPLDLLKTEMAHTAAHPVANEKSFWC